jgi:hypothetical protein
MLLTGSWDWLLAMAVPAPRYSPAPGDRPVIVNPAAHKSSSTTYVGFITTKSGRLTSSLGKIWRKADLGLVRGRTNAIDRKRTSGPSLCLCFAPVRRPDPCARPIVTRRRGPPGPLGLRLGCIGSARFLNAHVNAWFLGTVLDIEPGARATSCHDRPDRQPAPVSSGGSWPRPQFGVPAIHWPRQAPGTS